jgi:hypothetical protein
MSGYRFYYTDGSGITYTLTDGIATWLVVDGMRGFGQIPIEPPAERTPYTDGVHLMGRPYTGPRTCEVATGIMADSHAACVATIRVLRNAVNPYRTPDSLGTLKVVTPDDLTLALDCWLQEMGDPAWDGPTAATLTYRFWSPSPWFYDSTVHTATFGLGGPSGLAFPLDLSSGFVFGSSDIDGSVYAQNGGNVETYPIIRIYGSGENPSVENVTTGSLMELTYTLDDGDYIDIDMADGTIDFYDLSLDTTTNILDVMSEASTFWSLMPGENELHVTMSSVGEGTIGITWYDRYTSGL